MHEESKGTQLPITHVSLYKNGVGFFEHAGRVSGEQAVTIDLTTAQLNDVLQSLTAIDLNGGRITGAGYNSTTPIQQQLGCAPALARRRAHPAEPLRLTSGRPRRGHRTGCGLYGKDPLARSAHYTYGGRCGNESRQATERRFLTVVADSGATRTPELTGSTGVRLLDSPLRGDLTTYLALLGKNRTQGMRHLALTDRGTGVRELRVSFLLEVPIWKSTYRILFTDAPQGTSATLPASQTATLQGHSVIDNTVGEDWNNVQLSLIAGSPQSFFQPLAQPIYSRRPEIRSPGMRN